MLSLASTEDDSQVIALPSVHVRRAPSGNRPLIYYLWPRRGLGNLEVTAQADVICYSAAISACEMLGVLGHVTDV